MIPVPASSVAEVTGGELVPAGYQATVTAVVADSRAASPGALFVALRGERVDGHDYAGAAYAVGAVLVLGERRTPAPTVVVPDAVAALGRLARHVVDTLKVPVVGVTGSSGKTSTKDLLAAVLPDAVAPVGSYNNEIGLPLTVLAAERATRHLVLEMSARGVGHIAALCEIAPPTVGVVLNVGSAHLGEFGSRDAIARAKSELVAALPPTGLAVLNADDPVVARMPTEAEVVTFGATGDVRAERVELTRGRAAFRLVTPEGGAEVRLRLYGRHHVSNALAAAAVARWAGLGAAETAARLSTAVPASRWRMEVRETGDGVTVVNDAYNANPESMRAALDALVSLREGGRAWAVLGPMAELGDATEAEHAGVGRYAAEVGVDRVVGVGVEEYGGVTVPDADAALALLRAEVAPGDVVLVKASRAAALERVALALVPGGAG